MQYVVEVNGNVTNAQKKVYVVNAENESEAQKVAKNNFCSEFEADIQTVRTQSEKRTLKATLSIVFMIVSILLSFINWKVRHETISIRPDYLSCLYGILIYSAFVIRFKGIKRTTSSWIDILFCVIVVLLLATFAKTVLITKNIKFLFWNIKIDTNILLAITIVLSWVGVKFVSLLGMGIVGLFALFNIAALNDAMGYLFGPMYIICAFLGILLYFSVEPAVHETLKSMKLFSKNTFNVVNNDINYTKEVMKNNKRNKEDKGEKNER